MGIAGLILIGVAAAYLLSLLIRIRLPLRYAVEPEDLPEMADGIVVCRRAESPTGWVMVGDQDFPDSGVAEPVRLTGDVPPADAALSSENRYYCAAAYCGRYRAAGSGEACDMFDVAAWAPMFPVRRVSLLPNAWFSEGYLSAFDRQPVFLFGRICWREPKEIGEEAEFGEKRPRNRLKAAEDTSGENRKRTDQL